MTAIFKIAIPTFLVVSLTAFLVIFTSQAAPLTAAYLYLSRIQASLNGGVAGQEVEMVLAFAPSQNIASAGTVTIQFPDAQDTQWCRTAGALTVAGVTSSAADMATTNWAIDAALPGTLSATCAQGSGASSVDTITITGLTALTAGTTYGVKITNGTGKTGTATSTGSHEVVITVSKDAVIDSSTFKVSLVANDKVVVSATVSSVPTVNCSISTNTVALGALYPGGTYATGTHTISVDTTGSGYYWAAYGTGNGTNSGLWKSDATTYLIQSGPATTMDLRVAGSEGFGLTVSDPGGGATVPAVFSSATLGVFGTLGGSGVANAKLILYKNGSQGSAVNSTIRYGARAGSSAQAGSYSETVTFVCGGYY